MMVIFLSGEIQFTTLVKAIKEKFVCYYFEYGPVVQTVM